MKVAIRTTTVLIAAGMILLAVAASTIGASVLFSREYSRAVASKTRVVAQHTRDQLDKLLRFGIPLDELEGFDRQCADAVRADPDLASVFVVDAGGRVLFHSNPSWHGRALTDHAVLDAASAMRETSFAREDDGSTFDVMAVPLLSPGGAHIGAVMVESPRSAVGAKLRSLYLWAAAAAFGAFLLSGAILLAALSAWVHRPIERLIAATREIVESPSALSRRVRVNSPVEMARLAESFNAMLDALERTTVSRDLLVESEARYRAVVDQSLAGVFVAENGVLTFANPRFRTIFGYDETQGLEGTPLREFVHPGDWRKARKTLLRTGVETVSGMHKVRCRRRSGEVFPADVYLNAVTVGGSRRLVGMVVDVTREKFLESRLRESQKIEAVGRLAGGIAHDINNALSGIAASIESAKAMRPGDRSLGERLDAALEISLRAAERIRGLLAFGQRQPDQPEILDVNPLIAGMEPLLREFIGTDVVVLRLELAQALPRVRFDPLLLRQIVASLVSNSLGAMPRGGTIAIGTSEMPAGANPTEADGAAPRFVEIRVADTGEGIPPEIRDRIFEPNLTGGGEHRAGGLGLSVIHWIVRRAGGDVVIESAPGRGTVVRLRLPALDGPPLSAAAPEPPPPAAQPSAPPGSGRSAGTRVLLVDDEPTVRSMLVSLLNVLGRDVASAADGNEALRLLADNPGEFGLLITDLAMPGMQGTEVARRAREIRPGLPVLFISGYSDDTVGREVDTTGGASAYLCKPFTMNVLADRIRELEGGA